MIYFQTIQVDSLESSEIEDIIRRASCKSVSHLDLSSSTSYAGTEKKFFGYETGTYLIVTRIRGPIDKYLPKLILKFDKQIGFTEYKIRFSLLTAFLVGLLTLSSISILIECIELNVFDINILIPIIIFGSMILFTMLEIYISKKYINKLLIDKNKPAPEFRPK